MHTTFITPRLTSETASALPAAGRPLLAFRHPFISSQEKAVSPGGVLSEPGLDLDALSVLLISRVCYDFPG